MSNFSQRMGYEPDDTEITIRDDAPYDLRGVIVNEAYDAGMTPGSLRPIVCRVLQTRADNNNWTEYPNIDREIRDHFDDCPWYKVYDVVEAIHRSLISRDQSGYEERPAQFCSRINSFFRQNGIGWQLVNGRIEIRGEEGFEHTRKEATQELFAAGRATAAKEVHQAITDLSRRPEPDVTGAIQHALAALECVARDVTGDANSTLGKILSRHPDLFPSPLNLALEKLWGFASEQGRHLREGREPTYHDAELTVHVVSAATRYISRKKQDARG